MNNESLRRSLAYAAVAAALGLPGGAANAVSYSSAFDPPDFFGTATFDVTQPCLDAGPGFVSPYTLGCDVTWLSAEVTLKEGSFTPRTFSYDPVFLPSSSAVFNIWVEGGDLAGVNSAPIGPVIISGDPNPNFNGPWWIEYEFTPPDSELILLSSDSIGILSHLPSQGEFGLGIVNLFTGICTPTDIGGPLCVRNADPSEVAQVEFFRRISQEIPEPGTLGLILGAVGGAWLARRRKNVAG